MARGVGKVCKARDEMVREGRRLLRQGGPAALSFRNIARGLGCSPSVFYNYVPDIEALRWIVGREVVVELRTAMRLPLNANPARSLPRQIEFIAHAYRAFWRGEPSSLNFVFRRADSVMSEADYVTYIWPELAQVFGARGALMWWSRLHGIVHLETAGAIAPATAERLWLVTTAELERAASAAIAAAALVPAGADAA